MDKLLVGDAARTGKDTDAVTLRMTLLRASHDPDPLPDQGRHEIEWAIQPLTEQERAEAWAATAAREATEYQYPAQAQALTARELQAEPGAAPATAEATGLPPGKQAQAAELSWLELIPAGSVVWSVLKPWEGVPSPDADRRGQTDQDVPAQAEEKAAAGAGWIIRLYEVEGKTARVRVRFGPALLAERGRPATVEEVDLLEQSSLGHPLKVNEDGFDLELSPFEIKTIRFCWAQPFAGSDS